MHISAALLRNVSTTDSNDQVHSDIIKQDSNHKKERNIFITYNACQKNFHSNLLIYASENSTLG